MILVPSVKEMDHIFTELGYLEMILDCLGWKDIGQLDGALTNHELRPSFLLALRKFPRHQELDILQSLDLMLWLRAREIVAINVHIHLPKFLVEEAIRLEEFADMKDMAQKSKRLNRVF